MYVVLPLDQWRLANFGTITNSGPAADDADPDHDGLANLVEYALGLNPNTPNNDPLSFASVAGRLTITYQRPHPAPVDVSYIAEVSADLTSGVWLSGPAYTTQIVVNHNDGTETVSVTDLAGIAAPAHYLRVRFSR